jgi:hypothetical protein
MANGDHDTPKEPEPPEGFEVGSVDDAIVDEDATRRVWVKDDDKGVAYWFDLKEDVPLRKKNSCLEDNLTTDRGPNGEPRQNLSSGYYDDMLRYMVDDWFGADDPDAPGLATFLTQMGSVFESLQDEVPAPMSSLPDGDRGK